MLRIYCFLTILLFSGYSFGQEKNGIEPPDKLPKLKKIVSQDSSKKTPDKKSENNTGEKTTDKKSENNTGEKTTDKKSRDDSFPPIPKRKVIVNKVLPGYSLPPELRTSPSGPNAITAAVGLVSSFTESGTGGFGLSFSYNYMLGRYLWADFNLGFNFGGDCSNPSDDSSPMDCSGLSGFGTDILVGIMYRFLNWPNWRIPLNPYFRALTGVSMIVANGPNDGAALVVKTAFGGKYSFSSEFAVSAELGMKVGPSFRNDYGAGAFVTLDFLMGVEYSF
ncbi:MAG: hypothetical protein JXR95_12915 [Deltaproteobacteria bacterium]|nr:hypothetical protein [Deltaproteobacteria bacterium]